MPKSAARRAAALAVLAVGLAAVAGCIETRQEYTLNPNGSGKVVYEVTYIPERIGASPVPEPPEAALRRSVRALMAKASGVQAWKDIDYERLPDGRIRFKGTAYFDRLAALKLPLMKQSPVSWKAGEGGRMVLGLEDVGGKPVEGRRPELSKADLRKQVEAQRKEWEKNRPLVASMLAPMKIDLEFHLPGRVRSVSNFTKDDVGNVRLAFDGRQILKAMDELLADDAFMEEVVRSGRDVTKSGPGPHRLVNEKLFGLEGPVEAVVEGRLEPMFDYEKELAEARRGQAEMMKKLGLMESEAEVIEAK